MTQNDRPQFATLMKALGETYGGAAPSKEKIELYFRVLSDLTIEQLTDAITGLLNTRTTTTTFPVPGEIRNVLSGGKTAAIVALDKAEKAVEQFSAYTSVQFDDPVIHMAIESMGGWMQFCRPDDGQDWHWHQKEFLRLYEAFALRPRSCQNILPGMLAMDPHRQMMGLPERIGYIGDEQKRLAWTSRNSSPEQIADFPTMKQIDMKKL